MKNRKSFITIFVLLVLLGAAAWYFFLKRWDYKIIFSVPTHASIAYTFVKDHRDWNGKTLKAGQLEFQNEEPFVYLNSRLNINDTTFLFEWHFKPKNDSLTRVVVGVSDKDRNLRNRYKILFAHTMFEKQVKRNMKIIRDKIIRRNNEFRYTIAGLDSLAEIPCVYVSTKSTVRGKADEMIRNVIDLNMFVKDNDLGLRGNPMVVVKDWTPVCDSIHFDFCFPILHPERVPQDSGIGFRKVLVPYALRANFYGNYSYSDYSWNILYEKALKAGYRIDGKIVEVFYNDPHSGGNDKEWEAGIFLELKN